MQKAWHSPFKPWYPPTHSPNWSPYCISSKNQLREFDNRSKHFLFSEHFINSHNHFLGNIWILLGENWCWSLSGVNGLRYSKFQESSTFIFLFLPSSVVRRPPTTSSAIVKILFALTSTFFRCSSHYTVNIHEESTKEINFEWVSGNRMKGHFCIL